MISINPFIAFQARILKAFSPKQEYIVLALDILKHNKGCDLSEKSVKGYVEAIKDNHSDIVDDFMQNNNRIGILPLIVPVVNSSNPRYGLFDGSNKICKQFSDMLSRHIKHDFCPLTKVTLDMETVTEMIESGLKFMHSASVQCPTKTQVANRSLKLLSNRALVYNLKNN